MLPEYEDSKVNACIKNMVEIYERTSEDKSTQLLFCDMSTPKANTFNIYDEVKKKLIEKGISEEEIDFIHNANTDAQKVEMFAKVRNGSIRILLGSTAKMGAGTNVQSLLYAIHDLDCPWRPSDLEQRAGRIVRQGNTNDEVYIYRYVTEETFDAYLYQLVENKQKFISQIMTSKSPVRTAEDIDEASLSYAEIKALASGNPLIKEKMDLDVQVGKLKLEKATYLSQKYDLEDRVLKYYPKQLAQLQEVVEKAAQDYQKPIANDEFCGMELFTTTYTDKEQAGAALLLATKKITSIEEIHVGNYQGFAIYMRYDSFHNEHKLYLKNHSKYQVSLGNSESGNLTRIDNVIKSIPDIVAKAKEELAETQKQLENAKEEIRKPFAKEGELKEKSDRLSQLDKELDIGKGEPEMDTPIVEEETKEITEYTR